jgi:hypothetical protein
LRQRQQTVRQIQSSRMFIPKCEVILGKAAIGVKKKTTEFKRTLDDEEIFQFMSTAQGVSFSSEVILEGLDDLFYIILCNIKVGYEANPVAAAHEDTLVPHVFLK